MIRTFSAGLIIVLLVFFSATTHSQEKTGIVSSNWHPISSALFNPSSSADSRVYMQVNLIGLNVFAMTNAAYIPNFGLWSFILHPRIPAAQPFENKSRKYFFANAVVDGPSFFISKNNFGAGLFVRARTVLDARRMPYQFVDLLTGGGVENTEPQSFSFHNAKLANMSWVEYGGNFSYILLKKKNEMFTLGANVKYLTGLNLQYLNIADITGDYTTQGIAVSNLEGKYRAAPLRWKSGKGYAGDIGFNYKKMLKQVDNYRVHNPASTSKCASVDYKYKLSLAARDIGFIKYRGATTSADLQGAGIFSVNTDFQNTIEQQFSLTNNNGAAITAFLPAAVSAQADYNFENGFYANVTLNKSILPNNFIGVQSSDFIAVNPRFEIKQVEVALPLTMQRYRYPHLGFAFRFRTFVFGVDNVVPMIMKRNTSSVGVYLNLGFTIFKPKACKQGTRGVDDCGHYKNPKLKFKRKNSMVSFRPLKEKRHRHAEPKHRRKLFKRK